MSILVEVSRDGIDWERYDRTRTHIEDYQFLRHIDTVEKSWSRAQIENWLDDKGKAGARIEYSTDDGFSYVPFRLGRSDDAARIWTVIQNNRYIVRAMTLTEQLQQFNAANKTPNVRRESRWVYWTGDHFDFVKTEPNGGWVSRIDSDIVMSLSEPNMNTVTMRDGRERPNHAYIRGHVYVLKPCYGVPFKWETLIKTHRKNPSFDAREWVWVEAARCFDPETIQLGGIAIYAMTVLSDKYFVDSNRNPTKLGYSWLIRKEHKDAFIMQVNNGGGVATWKDAWEEQINPPVILEQPLPKFGGESNIQAESSAVLGEIMSVKAELQAAIESRDEQILAKVFFEAIEFRDKAVDELKELNTVIAAARQAAMEIMDGNKS